MESQNFCIYDNTEKYTTEMMIQIITCLLGRVKEVRSFYLMFFLFVFWFSWRNENQVSNQKASCLHLDILFR